MKQFNFAVLDFKDKYMLLILQMKKYISQVIFTFFKIKNNAIFDYQPVCITLMQQPLVKAILNFSEMLYSQAMMI